MKFSILFLLMLGCANVNTLLAQDSLIVIEKQILDLQQQPIEYANIWIKHSRKGALSDALGNFQIEVSPKDFLIISFLGFEEQELAVANLPSKISLKPKIYGAPEAIVYSGKGTIQDFGFNRDFKEEEVGGQGFCWNCRYITPSNYLILGRFIENNTAGTGIFQSVSFYLHPAGRSKFPMRIRIFEMDTLTGAPNKDLLQTSVVVTPKIKKGWVTVDLAKYQVLFPVNGAFVAMEWLPTQHRKYSYYFKLKKIYKPFNPKATRVRKMKSFGQILGRISIDQNKKHWVRWNGQEWKSHRYAKEQMVKAKIKIYE